MNYGEGFDPSGANDSFTFLVLLLNFPLMKFFSVSWVPMHEHGSSNTTINNSNASTTTTTTENTDNGGNNHISNTNQQQKEKWQHELGC